jgi:hypothetical protein
MFTQRRPSAVVKRMHSFIAKCTCEEMHIYRKVVRHQRAAAKGLLIAGGATSALLSALTRSMTQAAHIST